MRLHAALTAALAGGGGCSDAAQLLQLLTTSKAALRCLTVAARCGLLLVAEQATEAQQQERFVNALLCTSYSAAGTACREPTSLRLLWKLAVQQPGACAPAARKACDILLWCLPPPLPGLEGLLREQTDQDCPAAELAAGLQPAGSGAGSGGVASPFWRVSVGGHASAAGGKVGSERGSCTVFGAVHDTLCDARCAVHDTLHVAGSLHGRLEENRRSQRLTLHLASPCLAQELARTLVGAAAQRVGAGNAPAPADLQRLHQHLAADKLSRPAWRLSRMRFEAEQRGILRSAAAASGGKSVLSRLGKGAADLEAVDGFRAPTDAQQARHVQPGPPPATSPQLTSQTTSTPATAAPLAQPAANRGGSACAGGSATSQGASAAQRRLELLKRQLELKRQLSTQLTASPDDAVVATTAATRVSPPEVPVSAAAVTASMSKDSANFSMHPGQAGRPASRTAAAGTAATVEARAAAKPVAAGECASSARPPPVAQRRTEPRPLCQPPPGTQPQLGLTTVGPAASGRPTSQAGTDKDGPSVRWDAGLGRLDRDAGRHGPSWADQAEQWCFAEILPSASGQTGGANQSDGSQGSPATPPRQEKHSCGADACTAPEAAEVGRAGARGSCPPSAETACHLAMFEERCLQALGNSGIPGSSALQHSTTPGQSPAGSLPPASSLPAPCAPGEQECGQLGAPRLRGELSHTPHPAGPGYNAGIPPSSLLALKQHHCQPAPQVAQQGAAPACLPVHPATAFALSPPEAVAFSVPVSGPASPFGGQPGARPVLFVPPNLPSAQAAAGYASASHAVLAPAGQPWAEPPAVLGPASTGAWCRPHPPMPSPQMLTPPQVPLALPSAPTTPAAAVAQAAANPGTALWQAGAVAGEDMDVDGGCAPMQD